MSATEPTVTEIAAAIQKALETITGLRVVPYLGDTVSPPVAMVAIEKVTYHGAFQGGDVTHEFIIHLIVSRASDRAGLQNLEGYMSQSGPNSIMAALEADPTLGGVVSTSIVTESGPPSGLTIGSAVYIWVPFSVTAHA
jgi:hypothetical protein